MGLLRKLARNSPVAARVSAAQNSGEAISVGLSFAIALVIGVGIGWWLDQRFGWKPWGTLGGFALGMAAGVRNIYLVTKRYFK